MRDVVIVGAVRSPVGKRRGSLSHMYAPELLGDVLQGLFSSVDLDPREVGHVVGGCVGQVGMQSANVTRNAWLGAGLPLEVPSVTVTTQCGSSQEATTLAHGMLAGGLADVAVACGIESMSLVPPGSTIPQNPGFGIPRGGRYLDFYESTTQLEGADRIAEQWGLSRSDLEVYAKSSQDRAALAIQEGRFESQVIPLNVPVANEEGVIVGTKLFRHDEGPRATTLEGLAGLKPNLPDRAVSFHTAGTSSQISDGSGALLLMTTEKASDAGLRPRARIVHSVLVGSDPELMLTGPIPATKALLDRSGLTMDDIDLFEVNEAFASVVLAWAKETGADLGRVNVNGGAIALGHPLGGTGTILITKALYELERIKGRFAMITMCCGGGLGTGTLIERL